MKITIKKRYLYIYIAILALFSVFYATLFVISRIQYLEQSLESQRSITSDILFERANLNNMLNDSRLRHFINYAQNLEYFYTSDTKTFNVLISKNTLYDFVALIDKSTHSKKSTNTNYSTLINIYDIRYELQIKTLFAFDNISKKTYNVFIYPIIINGILDSHIVAYLDITNLVNFDGIFLVAQNGLLMNDTQYNVLNIIYNNFSFEYPQEWGHITSRDEGQFITDNGIFTYHILESNFTSIGDTIQMDKYYFVSVLPIDPNDSPYHIDSISSFMKYVDFNKNITYWIIGYIWIICTSVILLMVIINNMENSELSKFDSLTGTYNRRKGFVKIKKLAKDFSSTKEYIPHIIALLFKNRINSIHFCMVDIDGLKQVNDKLGHKYGDEMITTIVNIISKGLNKNEFMMRMGGDEFLIVFINRDFASIDKYWSYVYQEFNEKNNSNTKYTLKVSHGVVEYNVNDDIDKCIIDADELMYKEKRRHKVNLFFN